MYKLLIVYILLLAGGTTLSLPLFGKEIQFADVFFIFILAKLMRGFLKSRRSKLFNPPPLIRNLIVTLLALLFISSLFSPDRTKSLIEFASITYLVILYLWVSGINMDEERLKSLLHIWLYISGGLCIFALLWLVLYAVFGTIVPFVLRFVHVDPMIKSVIPFARAAATFPSVNMFASFLHVSVVFLMSLILHERPRRRYMFLGMLFLVCLFLTASRNLLGIFITVFVALLPVRGRLGVSASKYIVLGLVIIFSFLVLITTVWCIFPARIDYDRKNEALSVSINTAPSLYAILNRMSIRFIKQKPLLGIGPGMFNQELMEQADWNEVSPTYEAKGLATVKVGIDPHNTYLGWAAEAGQPFVIVMTVLFLSIAWLIWRGCRFSSNTFAGGFCYVCMCGLIGFMVNASYIDILTMRHFWLMIGLGTLAAAMVRQE